MKKFQNTLQKGSVRYLIFKDKDVFFGVALEFNVIVEAASQIEALVLLDEATQGFLESARKIKLRPSVLNQKPDSEYEKMWEEYQDRKLKEKSERTFNCLPIFNAGWMELAKR
ncbi:MAG: hypothetical protein AAB404_00090 [Patescibacteria group bacterium]